MIDFLITIILISLYNPSQVYMDYTKLLSRYIILTLFAFTLRRYNPRFCSIIVFKTMLFLMLCIYLDYLAPRINSIRYHELNKQQEKQNAITPGVGLTVFVNYCIHFLCLWLTIRYAKKYDLTAINLLKNYLMSLPLSIVASFIFYYSHRLLHTKYLYGYVHKSHHVYANPSSFVAIYSSVPDFLFSNCLSMFGPYFIFNNIHPHFITAYSFIGICDIFINHTSYYFNNKLLDNLIGGSQFHHTHHVKYKYNYGLNNRLFDMLHNTCDQSSSEKKEIY
jgi:sterol desaturase/sphingolipid hydroxylase (fatty acid hydroxylase superfamily)